MATVKTIKWVEQFICNLSAEIIKEKISLRAGRVCAKYIRTHYTQAVQVWNQGRKIYYRGCKESVYSVWASKE